MSLILAILACAALSSAILLAALSRLLPAGFLAAAVTSRSNHSGPARQIGGLAVIPAALVALTVALISGHLDANLFWACAAGAAILMLTGYADDRHDLGALPKLALQFAGCGLFAVILEPEARLFPELLPLVVERILAVFFLVWFVNMTNFMDGLDLMIVSGIGVPHLVLAGLGLFALLDLEAAILSAALAGALLGFAPFNRPPARIFLGDNGSLPLGFLTGVVVLLLAGRHPIAALVPFLYFFVDTLSVLVLRARQGRNLFEAHSEHAYQIARRAGRSSAAVAGRVALLSLCCAFLAAVAMTPQSPAIAFLALVAAAVLTGAATLRMRRTSGPTPAAGKPAA